MCHRVGCHVEIEQEKSQCPECDGAGYFIVAKCCGNITPHGECKGFCHIQDQDLCDVCGGRGVVLSPIMQNGGGLRPATPERSNHE